MKRITKLEISNFRAFFDNYEIELNKGENLLIYGENGSGKSSLFKSINNFLSSSQNPAFNYVKHHNKDTQEGILSFTFHDYNPAINTITSPYGEVISFGSNVVTTDTEQFIKTADLTKGFLDYKGLLAIYNHDEAQPNLFELIILNLFKNFIPTHLGATEAIGKIFKQLFKKITEAYNRNTYDYRDGIPEMATFENLLRQVLHEVFLQLNAFLIKYFKLNMRVWYSLTPLSATGYWRDIPKELKLEVKLNGVIIRHQSDFLNEARLSALAICLYLAVIKRNQQPIDFKILFLDDVFIGLDLTNRLPILDIIKNEFSDYQVFISTYDRHLYELANRKFETETPGRWKSVELYVGKDSINNELVDRPILVVGQSHFEKGSQYLHDRQKPDYPAAANYFRKSLEEIIQEYFPKWETIDPEITQLPDYKLGTLIYRAKRFLDKSGNSSNSLNQIITLLSSILHPLSHHEITSPVYRGELVIIENLIPKLITELKALDIRSNFKCSVLEGRNKIKIRFVIDAATGHYSIYELRITEPLVLKFNAAGAPTILDVHCFAEKCWGENNGAVIAGAGKTFSKEERELPRYNFNSIQDAYDRLHAFMIKIPAIGVFAKSANYLDDIEYLDQQGNYQPITNVIVW
jgi:energy-coupling factor transporter ATP-binding protein EcfA2